MCSCSPESQYPGLLQKRGGQQREGDDWPSLLCRCEASSVVLCPGLRPSAQERHTAVGVDAEESHRDDQSAETLLL